MADIEIPFLFVNRDEFPTVLPTGVSPTADDTAVIKDNDGNAFLAVANTDDAPHNVTAVTTASIAGMALADTVIQIAGGATGYIGPWPPALYNADDNSVSFTDDSDGLLTYVGFRF